MKLAQRSGVVLVVLASAFLHLASVAHADEDPSRPPGNCAYTEEGVYDYDVYGNEHVCICVKDPDYPNDITRAACRWEMTGEQDNPLPREPDPASDPATVQAPIPDDARGGTIEDWPCTRDLWGLEGENLVGDRFRCVCEYAPVAGDPDRYLCEWKRLDAPLDTPLPGELLDPPAYEPPPDTPDTDPFGRDTPPTDCVDVGHYDCPDVSTTPEADPPLEVAPETPVLTVPLGDDTTPTWPSLDLYVPWWIDFYVQSGAYQVVHTTGGQWALSVQSWDGSQWVTATTFYPDDDAGPLLFPDGAAWGAL